MQSTGYFRRLLGRVFCGLCILVLAGCASSPGPSKDAKIRDGIATYALSLLNAPYVWGGHDVTTGFDCSGFVSHVYHKAAGIELQGNAATLAKTSRPVSSTEALAGDLVFFNTMNRPASHVGIYLGNNQFVHASNPRTGVRVDRLDNTYYAKRFEGAKALLN